MKKYTFFCLLVLCTFSVSAVHVNHRGLGQVLLVPYYTVNNDLNTLVSVTNPTDTSKAIKINIREGLNGHAVLSYNVYLSAYDTWTFVFVGSTSTVAGFSGQDSVRQYSSDTSCAPFLQKAGQEFLPFEFTDGPQDLSRAREGFIEIIEMGELQGDFIAAAAHGFNSGVPADCAAFEAAWLNGGVWDAASGGDINQDITAGSGRLMVETDIINVAEGINYSIPVIALDGFFTPGSINHADPGDTSLSLDSAAAQATVLANNKAYELSFETGIDAVSAVLMADELIGTYALDSIVGGLSETVFTQPTRRFYYADSFFTNPPPYPVFTSNSDVGQCSLENYRGTDVIQDIFDRESQVEVYEPPNIGVLPPPPPNDTLCGSVFVQSIIRPGVAAGPPRITQSNNFGVLTSPAVAHATENGFIRTRFLDTRPLVGTDINSGQSVQLMGLPIIGITLQQFTNAGAADGLLAQYGGAHQVKSRARVIEP
jgi:hypothetical protein